MASNPKRNTKVIVTGICIAALATVVVVTAIIFATKSATQISDAYFVSNDKQYVLNLTGDMLGYEDNEYAPVAAHIVYKYSGDKITNITSYLEFADESTASTFLPKYKEIYAASNYSGIKSISINGKYIVVIATEDQFSDASASEIKEEIESFKNSVNTTVVDETTETSE